MINRYLETLRDIFDPIAVFVKDEEFIVVVKDEHGLEERIKDLHTKIDDELSLVILTSEEFARMNEKDLGERVL